MRCLVTPTTVKKEFHNDGLTRGRDPRLTRQLAQCFVDAVDKEVKRNHTSPLKKCLHSFHSLSLETMSFWSSMTKKKTLTTGSAKRSHLATNDPSSSSPSHKKPKSVTSDNSLSSPMSLIMPPVDIDSDTEPPKTLQVLDWRMDPEESFADWIMEIEAQEDSEEVRTYHVHRNIVMIASPMFRELFGRHGHRSPSSSFVLPKKATDAFEMFLDFVYQLNRVEFSTENAAALYYLGRAFGVERLRWEAKQFWQEDIAFGTLATYYEDAVTFDEEVLAYAVMKACLEDSILDRFAGESEILKVADIRLMMFLVENKGEECSVHLSNIVSEFCSLHGIDYTHESFAKLTEKLPKLSFEAATTFLALEDPELGLELSSLQQRCASAIAADWQKLDVSSDTWTASHSPILLVKILQSALVAAQTQAKTATETQPGTPSENSTSGVIQCSPSEETADKENEDSFANDRDFESASIY